MWIDYVVWVGGWRGAGYVATSRLDVDKPGNNMERRPQELLSTGRVVIVLARQLTSAVSHVVWRQWRNAVIIMQTVETADQCSRCHRWKKTQTTSIISTFLQIRGFFFFINCLQIIEAKCLGIAPVTGRRFWSLQWLRSRQTHVRCKNTMSDSVGGFFCLCAKCLSTDTSWWWDVT